MKVCFFLQRRFAYLGHDIAVHLKNRHGVDSFCAYVSHRPSYRFLKNQKEIKYTTLLLNEDIHKHAEHEILDKEYIAYLEREYGIPNLWPYIEVDRIIRLNQQVREYPMDIPQHTHEEMMLHLQVRAKAIIEMLEKEKPDVLICSVVANLGAMLLFHIAKKMGIKVLVIQSGRVGSRYMVSEAYDGLPEIDASFTQLMQTRSRVDNYDEAHAILEKFREQPLPHDTITDFYLKRARRSSQLDFLLPRKIAKYIQWLVGSVKYYIRNEDKHDFSYIKLSTKIKDQIVRKLRTIRGFADLYDSIDPDNEDFAFFPLHMEPEAALHVFGYWHRNQLEAVRQTARSLPLHFKLYVKDHPRMVGFRTRKFYKELKKIPNVKLVRPQINSLAFLDKAKLAIVISGSVGWEAVQLKVPVITFGNVFYNSLPMVRRCSDYEELPYVVQQQLTDQRYDELAITNYIGLILKNSILIDLVHLWHRESDKQKKRQELITLADLIAQHM